MRLNIPTKPYLIIASILLILSGVGSFAWDIYHNHFWNMYWLWIADRTIRIAIGMSLIKLSRK